MSVSRIYVEKKPNFAVEAKGVLSDLQASLSIKGLNGVRVINRYDIEGTEQEVLEKAYTTVFSEPAIDDIYFELPELAADERIFAVEYLPGQFDQRADSCAQCIQLLAQCERPTVQNARLYILSGKISDEAFEKIKSYLINPVESREASFDLPETLERSYEQKTEVEVLNGFIGFSDEQLDNFVKNYGLAMDSDDLAFCQSYFKETEKRDPTITEIRMIDTYWSDHCRHTTFLTNIDIFSIHDNEIRSAFNSYQEARSELYKGRTDKPVTLMDLAVIGAKKLKADGLLDDLDESDEINACTIKIKVDVDGVDEDWLLLFKNETHNHPTEIEPFGGAATCLGGAIRDPLSGRAYVYQAMRVTGAANPLRPFEETIKGKLPQRKIVTGAAAGYSSYGNQIGLATGQVSEIYHEGYAAKRMEIGAVIGAAPQANVVRQKPQPGDMVVLLGGRTGRDGCGGATGSSKSHTSESLESCGAEVQKGNPPEERKIQRLFRNPEATTLIKCCNDFGAGGVSVAIGELADGLEINLNAVPKKYDGLDGTELAISESQERMACVVAKENVEKFRSIASSENIESTVVATVTEQPRLKMEWNGKTIVDLSREFLNSNGATKHTSVEIGSPKLHPVYDREISGKDICEHMKDLNLCSQKGLSERFDSTVGAGSVLMPFGGEYQLTPTQAMAAKIPVTKGETTTASVMAWGFNPYISEQSPYHGAIYAVVESIAKLVATGGKHEKCRLTFQEYFERTQNDPKRWGKPAAALLGALKAQLELGAPSIGGKDSMSGTFEDIDVPPTLVSFAVSLADSRKIISPEFKGASHKLALILPKYNNGVPDFESVKAVFKKVEQLIENEKVYSCWALTSGGLCEGLVKMSLGNRIGAKLTAKIDKELMYNPVYGGFILELPNKFKDEMLTDLGVTTGKHILVSAENSLFVELKEAQKAYEAALEGVFPYRIKHSSASIPTISYKAKRSEILTASTKFAKPRILIPAFPGTNCEEDSARAFEKAGGDARIFVVKNLSSAQIEESVNAFAKAIGESQIIMIPGGFSGGDEPDGSAKFITAFFKNPKIKEAVTDMLDNRDGLMLGICNGFQALIKLGLLPYGKICDCTAESPTLTYNTIGRHQSMMVNTRISSNKSPWLSRVRVGDIHTIPISHGEGRFIAPKAVVESLIKNGQVATQYVDLSGQPTYDIAFNPNESYQAIEGILSPNGRVFGKMGHSERCGNDIHKNIPGEKDQFIFKAGVEYFR